MSSLQAFYAGAFNEPTSNVGLTVSVQEAGPFPVPIANSAWQPLLTTATVLPQGLWLISVKSFYTNGITESADVAVGVVSTSTTNTPLSGTYAESNTVPCPLQTTCTFVSSEGFQSPKFVYFIDTDSVRIGNLQWTAVKLS